MFSPPYEGPYQEMMVVTTKTHTLALRNHSGAAVPPQGSTVPNETDWDNVTVTMNPL